MARHQNQWDLAEEAINDYLQIIRLGLEFPKKPEGSCLGYPSALLMLCLINAFGTYLAGEKVTINGKLKSMHKHPFWVLNHPLFGQHLTSKQIERIEHAYRNRLAHNAMLDPESALVPGGHGEPFRFKEDYVEIALGALHTLIDKAWQSFDKKKIQEFVEKEQRKKPAASR